MSFTATYPVLHLPAIADNLIAYFETNQVAALALVGGTLLKPLQNFNDSVANRSTPVFPAIAFRDDSDAVDYGNDTLAGAYTVIFELMVTDADPDEALRQSRIYVKAIKLMIRNIPNSTLISGTGAITGAAYLDTMESGTDPVRANDEQTDFLQLATVKAAFGLVGAAFS